MKVRYEHELAASQLDASRIGSNPSEGSKAADK